MKYFLIVFEFIIFNSFLNAQAFEGIELFDLDYFSKSRTSEMAYDLSNDIIYTITVNTQNDPYIYGISFYQNGKWNELSLKDSNYPITVNSQLKHIQIDKNGALWLSSEEGILNYIQNKGWSLFTVDPPPAMEIIYNFIMLDTLGKCWFHVEIVEPNGDIYHKYENRLYKNDQYPELIFKTDSIELNTGIRTFSKIMGTACATSQEGNLWFAHSQSSKGLGLVKIDPYTSNLEFFQLKDQASVISQKGLYPYDLDFTDEGRILVTYTANTQESRRGGVSNFDPVNQLWDHVEDDDGIQNENISILNRIENTVIDDFGIYWIGTRGWGIIKLDLEKKTNEVLDLRESFGVTKQHFLNDIKDSFKDKHGNLWFSTPDGIVKIVPSATSFADNDIASKGFIAYPNPVKSGNGITFFLDETISEEINITIYNLEGSKLSRVYLNPGTNIAYLTTSGFAAGLYVAKYKNKTISFIITN